MLHKIFWVVTWRCFLVYDQRFGITGLSHLQGLEEKDPEDGTDKRSRTLIIYQKTTPGNNPEDIAKSFWVVARCQFLVYNQRFGNTYLSHLQGQTSVPEMLVIHQKFTPGYNPKTFKQH
jgi:hypothetical protein